MVTLNEALLFVATMCEEEAPVDLSRNTLKRMALIEFDENILML